MKRCCIQVLNTQFLARTHLENHPNYLLNHLGPHPDSKNLQPINLSIHIFLNNSVNLLNMSHLISPRPHLMKSVHTQLVSSYLSSLPLNPILNLPTPDLHPALDFLPCIIRVKLSEPCTNLSPFLLTYQNRLKPHSLTHLPPNVISLIPLLIYPPPFNSLDQYSGCGQVSR